MNLNKVYSAQHVVFNSMKYPTQLSPKILLLKMFSIEKCFN